MIKLTLSEVIEAVRGKVNGQAPTASVKVVSTDSRSVGVGDLFIALRGDRFDGHDFVKDVSARRACAAVVSADQAARLRREIAEQSGAASAATLIEVDDTLEALARLAAYHRRQLSITVIAVVGSNGKTTSKAMIHHLLSARWQGRASPRSYNNAIGVPLTLLSSEAADDYLVVEIGTNAPGEVAELADWAQPQMAVITSVGEEHLEGLGDLDGVVAEECSILRHLCGNGFSAVNIDSPRVSAYLNDEDANRITFGGDPACDLRISETHADTPWLCFELNGRFKYRLQTVGTHNAANAAGAIAIARRWGMTHEEIAERLESFVAPPMRMEIQKLGGVTVVNDAYNANPHSAQAAIEALEAMPAAGRRIAVFGEMRELGVQSEALHRRVARRLGDACIDHVLLIGKAGETMYDELREAHLFGPSVDHCADIERCSARLGSLLRDGDVVLLKASRAVGLERLVDGMRAEARAVPIG